MGEVHALNVVFISTSVGFPYGMASSSRIRLLALSLVKQGSSVSVLVIRGTEKAGQKSLNTKAQGVWQGVSYEYVSGSPFIPRQTLVRGFYRLCGFIKTMLLLAKLKEEGKLDVVIFYTRDLWTIAKFSKVCHRLNIPVVLELCEWPIAQVNSHGGSKGRAEKFCREVFDYVDAVIPISSFIEDRVREYGCRKGCVIPWLRIPALVDVEGFQNSQARSPEALLMYCGSLGYRNILKTVVDTCVILKKRHLSFRMTILGGQSSPDEFKWAREYVHETGVLDRIDILEYVSDSDLRKTYEKATAFLAPIPNDLQSLARFPTKIGEYLASGRPVITTRFGEAAYYLKDGVNAFVVEEYDAARLAEKVLYVTHNPAKAINVGIEGRNLAYSSFHYDLYGAPLLAFLQEIVVEKNDSFSSSARACSDKC
jgi:glycosyltransferase involved in cell wall biosynthesis